MLLAATRLVGGGDAFMEPPQNLQADILQDLGKSKGAHPAAQTPAIPDEAVLLDAGHVCGRHMWWGLRRVRRIFSKCLVPCMI
jgi:hypothetical protein